MKLLQFLENLIFCQYYRVKEVSHSSSKLFHSFTIVKLNCCPSWKCSILFYNGPPPFNHCVFIDSPGRLEIGIGPHWTKYNWTKYHIEYLCVCLGCVCVGTVCVCVVRVEGCVSGCVGCVRVWCVGVSGCKCGCGGVRVCVLVGWMGVC